MKKKRTITRTISYIFLIITSFCMIYPVLFMVLGAFTTNERFLDATILPIPNTLNIELFTNAMRAGVWDSYVFTLIRVGFYMGVTLLVGLIGAYILSKMSFPGKNKVFLIFLSGMVMPGILMLVPMYLM